ncbi:MAG: hypothetical protein ACOC0V_01095 [Oceanicaulis sp.]
MMIGLIGLFIALCGALFIVAPFLRGTGFGAKLAGVLELDGRFETFASVFTGMLFLLSGGALLTGFEQPR